MRSPLYWHSTIYHGTMRLLYGPGYGARLEAVSERIQAGSSVVELCCADGRLYAQHLSGRVARYVGFDINASFVKEALRRRVPAEVRDLRQGEFPQADVVVLQGSLFQFGPDHAEFIRRMVRAARSRVIVAEPVRNLAASANPLVAWLASRLTDPGTHPMAERFDEAGFRGLLSLFTIVEFVPIAGGRELLAVIDAAREDP